MEIYMWDNLQVMMNTGQDKKIIITETYIGVIGKMGKNMATANTLGKTMAQFTKDSTPMM